MPVQFSVQHSNAALIHHVYLMSVFFVVNTAGFYKQMTGNGREDDKKVGKREGDAEQSCQEGNSPFRVNRNPMQLNMQWLNVMVKTTACAQIYVRFF